MRRRGRARGVLHRVGGEAAHAQLRYRRRRHQSRRHRAARKARCDSEVPSVGDRVQVSGPAGAHEAPAHRRQRGADGRRHAVRPARAGVSGGFHDLDGHAAQRGGRRAQGSSRRRHRRDRKRRRRHPEGRRAHLEPSTRGRRAVGDADASAPCAAARCIGTKKKWSGDARTPRARRAFAAASSISPRGPR